MNNHPEQLLLLRYIDGELTGRKARSVQRHIEACGECRAEIEELQATVADCVRYRKHVLTDALPAPPQEWVDIYREFDRIDAAASRLPVFPWRWGLAAATAALAIAGGYYFKAHEAPATERKVASSNKITEPLLRNSVESGAATVEVPLQPAVPSRQAAVVPGPTASISDELQVLSALHEIGADLGDPVQVSLSGSHVQVSAVGLAPARKQKILAALEPLPKVSVSFSDPPSMPLPNDATAAATADTPAPIGEFQSRLEVQLGGHSAVDRLAGQVLSWNESAMSNAYALRSLARQFPSDGEMSDKDRAVLRGLAKDHVAALASPIASYDRTLAPVLRGLGASRGPVAVPDFTAWQSASEQVFQAAQRVEMLSSLLLGVTLGKSAHADLPSELLGAVNDLRADLDQSQRLLGR